MIRLGLVVNFQAYRCDNSTAQYLNALVYSDTTKHYLLRLTYLDITAHRGRQQVLEDTSTKVNV